MDTPSPMTDGVLVAHRAVGVHGQRVLDGGANDAVRTDLCLKVAAEAGEMRVSRRGRTAEEGVVQRAIRQRRKEERGTRRSVDEDKKVEVGA